MPPVVVDTNILVRVLIPSQLDVRATNLLQHFARIGLDIVVPSQVASEAMSRIRNAVSNGAIPTSEGYLLLDELKTLLTDIDVVQWDALRLAAQFNRPSTYDCEPYALAESLGADLWTADDRFVNAMQAQRPAWVHRLSEFDPATTT